MAGSGTRVTAEALATAIQNYEARKQEFTSAYTNINKVVQTLSSNYKSENADIINLSQVTGANSEVKEHKKELERQEEGQDSATWLKDPVQRRLSANFDSLYESLESEEDLDYNLTR